MYNLEVGVCCFVVVAGFKTKTGTWLVIKDRMTKFLNLSKKKI